MKCGARSQITKLNKCSEIGEPLHPAEDERHSKDVDCSREKRLDLVATFYGG